MKKIILFVLAALCALTLVACGEDSSISCPPETEAVADVSLSDYRVVYDISDSNAIGIMTEMLNVISSSVGVKPQTSHSGNPENELEIEFGLKSGREASALVADETARYSGESRSAYVIRAVGKKIVISATDNDALRLAADRFAVLAAEGIDSSLDEIAVYDSDAYKRSGEVKLFDAEAIGSSVSVLSISVDGRSTVGFKNDVTEYNVAVSDPSSFEVKVVTEEPLARVSISREGTSARVCVESINRRNERVFVLNAFKSVESEIVNKNGADATVTFVLDDGDQASATFVMDKMAPKYPSLKASFALIANKLATLDIVTNPDGTKEYAKDEDGFYTYKRNESVWAYWENLVKNKNYEIVSHSYSHKYWGENDGGGKFDYYNTAGEKFTSEDLPKGSVSKEFVASKQIIQDLDPSQPAAVFVRSGLTAGGKNVKYSDTFWDPIETSGAYIGGRGTHTYPDKPRDMVNIFSEFDKPEVRNKIKSYMVQHYNTSPSVKTTQADSGPAECLAAGIPYWTNYIDTAVEMKGWAAFCIHNIRPDTHDTRSGHYIYQSQADQLFGHAQRLSDEGKLWIATLSEGMIYANEWVASSVWAYEDGGKLFVSLDCADKNPIYNMPLTVKVALPAGKTSASLEGKALKCVTENGKAYVLADVVPGTTLALSVQ